VLLFCIASGTDWQKAGVTGVTVMLVKGLVERTPRGGDAGGRRPGGAHGVVETRMSRRLVGAEKGAGTKAGPDQYIKLLMLKQPAGFRQMICRSFGRLSLRRRPSVLR
jgi:hypothetical protein